MVPPAMLMGIYFCGLENDLVESRITRRCAHPCRRSDALAMRGKTIVTM